MTVSVRAVREAIADALSAIDGLNTSPLLTDSVILPQAMVRMTAVSYRETFSNSLTAESLLWRPYETIGPPFLMPI